MKKSIILLTLTLLLLISCRQSQQKQTQEPILTEEQKIPLEDQLTNQSKAQLLLEKLGEYYKTNPPGVVGYTMESENAPKYIGGVYLDDHGRLVIQVVGDSLTGRRELERVLQSDEFIVEPEHPGMYSQKQLYAINEQLHTSMEKIKGDPMLNNIMGYGVGLRYIEIYLIMNTPERRKEFREKLMDSPAFRFSGTDVPVASPVTGVNDTLGIYLRPRFTAYSTTTKQAEFIIYNRSGIDLMGGTGYFITYEDKDGIWRELPINTTFNDLGILIAHNKSWTIKANLYPDLHINNPGRYRFFYNLNRGRGNNLLMMCYFQLTDKPSVYENAPETAVPSEMLQDVAINQYGDGESPDDDAFEVVEVMPEFPGGQNEIFKFINEHLPKDFPQEGRVIVQFVVEKDGSLSNFIIVRSLGKETDDIALNIVKKMPKWIPGSQDGKLFNFITFVSKKL